MLLYVCFMELGDYNFDWIQIKQWCFVSSNKRIRLNLENIFFWGGLCMWKWLCAELQCTNCYFFMMAIAIVYTACAILLLAKHIFFLLYFRCCCWFSFFFWRIFGWWCSMCIIWPHLFMYHQQKRDLPKKQNPKHFQFSAYTKIHNVIYIFSIPLSFYPFCIAWDVLYFSTRIHEQKASFVIFHQTIFVSFQPGIYKHYVSLSKPVSSVCVYMNVVCLTAITIASTIFQCICINKMFLCVCVCMSFPLPFWMRLALWNI